MKVIDLLNKIANDEEVPKTIYYCGKTFEWTGLNYYCKENDEFLDEYICLEDLEYEAEIIDEHKIPKKLEIREEKNIKNNWKWKVCGKEHEYNISMPQKIIADKINEIIDYLEIDNE